MASVREVIQQLYEKRRGLIEQQRELHAQIEARIDSGEDGEFSGEDNAKWEKLDKEIRETGQRIDHLVTLEEQNKDLDEQRGRFESMLKAPQNIEDTEKSTNDRLRTWLKAALPESEVWAPKSITLYFRNPAAMEQHDLTKGTATDGAELIPTGFVRRLYEHLVEFSAIRRTNSTVYTTASGENLLVPKTTAAGAAVLVAEAAALSEDDPQYGQVTLNAYKFGQLIEVSRELIEDSAVDLLGHLARFAGRALGTVTGTYMVTGTGTAQPEGIANSPTAGKTGATGQTTSVTAEDLIDLYHSIISGYRANAFWVMRDATAAAVRKLREGTGATAGNFLWQPGLQAGQPDTLLGRPVVTDPNVAAMAANAYSIAFGDFSEYFAIRDVNAIRFERSDDFRFANDLVAFRSLVRMDSKQIVNGANGAVKFYRNSAT